MRLQLTASDCPARATALAVIGTWDPLLPAHRKLFRQLARRGTKAGLTPVVIVLFPSPVRLLNRDPDLCLEYTDLKARIALIRECAPVKVLTIRMTTKDLDTSTRSFFDLIGTHISLRELWLGANQSLGRCKQGSDAAIVGLAHRRKIALRRLDACKASRAGGAAFRFLGAGKLKDAIQCTGNAPIWGRPKSDMLRLNWPPGDYVALPMIRPSFTPVSTHAPIRVTIVPAKRGGTLEWPAREVEWLSFLAGPADRPSAWIGRRMRGSQKLSSP